MGAGVKPVDVTGRFESVTGRRSSSWTLYHKEKSGELPLQAVPRSSWNLSVIKIGDYLALRSDISSE